MQSDQTLLKDCSVWDSNKPVNAFNILLGRLYLKCIAHSVLLKCPKQGVLV